MRREEKTGEARRKGGRSARPAGGDGWAASLGQRPGVAAHDWQGRRGVRGPRCSRIKEAPGLGAGCSAIGERRGRGRGKRGSEPCRAAASESGEREGGASGCGAQSGGRLIRQKEVRRPALVDRAGRQRHEREGAGEALSGMEKEAGQALQKAARRKIFPSSMEK